MKCKICGKETKTDNCVCLDCFVEMDEEESLDTDEFVRDFRLK